MDAPKELFAGGKRGRVVTRKSAKLRESPRRFTKVRTDQGRGYAIVRIITGGSFFFVEGMNKTKGTNGTNGT